MNSAKRKVLILHHPLDLSPSYYRGIGEVIARMALFEYHLMDAIAVFIPVVDPKKKRVLLMSMSINPKLGIFKSLVQNWLPDSKLKNEIFQVIDAAQELKQFRHKIAHGVWGHPEGKPKARKLSLVYVDEPKEVYLPKSSKLSPSDLKAFAGAIRGLDLKLRAATKLIPAALAAA